MEKEGKWRKIKKEKRMEKEKKEEVNYGSQKKQGKRERF